MKKLLLTVIISMCLSGCMSVSKSNMPEGAKVVREYDSGWIVFELDGNEYLFKKEYFFGYPIICISKR